MFVVVSAVLAAPAPDGDGDGKFAVLKALVGIAAASEDLLVPAAGDPAVSASRKVFPVVVVIVVDAATAGVPDIVVLIDRGYQLTMSWDSPSELTHEAADRDVVVVDFDFEIREWVHH